MDIPSFKSIHVPVMVKEVVELLDLRPGMCVVDGTTGEGGHGLTILEKIGDQGLLIGLDRDITVLERAQERFTGLGINRSRFTLIKGSYDTLDEILNRLKIERVDRILLDLGFSSFQIESDRGFGFVKDSRLDMRYDRDEGATAAEVVNRMSARNLAALMKRYGDERWARHIAKRIEQRRKEKPIETTRELAAVAEEAIPRRYWSRTRHPAAKLFQSLRIYVNNELDILKCGLEVCLKSLAPGGRLAAISYHSGEDRIVKNTYREAARTCVCPPSQPVCTCGRKKMFILVTRGPRVAGDKELRSNRRARSAKLRVIEKAGVEGGGRCGTCQNAEKLSLRGTR